MWHNNVFVRDHTFASLPPCNSGDSFDCAAFRMFWLMFLGQAISTSLDLAGFEYACRLPADLCGGGALRLMRSTCPNRHITDRALSGLHVVTMICIIA